MWNFCWRKVGIHVSMTMATKLAPMKTAVRSRTIGLRRTSPRSVTRFSVGWEAGVGSSDMPRVGSLRRAEMMRPRRIPAAPKRVKLERHP